MAGCVEDRVYERGHNRNHHHFRHALRTFVRVDGRQDLDLQIAQRQVRPASDEVLSEVPLPVAGAVLVKRQRLEQRKTNAHREAALRLSEHDPRNKSLAAFQHAVCFCDTQRSRCPVDLDADQRAALRRVRRSALVEIGWRKRHVRAVDADKFARAATYGQRIDVGRPLLSVDRERRARPVPAIEGVRHCAGYAIACMRLCGDRRQGQWRQSLHHELAILPPRLAPFAGLATVRHDTP